MKHGDAEKSSGGDITDKNEGVSYDPKTMAKTFKDTFSRQVTVRFVGVWYILSRILVFLS